MNNTNVVARINPSIAISSLQRCGLIVLELPKPDGDEGTPQILVGEATWSCAVSVIGLDAVIPLEGPYAYRQIQINELIRDGQISVWQYLGGRMLKNDRMLRACENEVDRAIQELTERLESVVDTSVDLGPYVN